MRPPLTFNHILEITGRDPEKLLIFGFYFSFGSRADAMNELLKNEKDLIDQGEPDAASALRDLYNGLSKTLDSEYEWIRMKFIGVKKI